MIPFPNKHKEHQVAAGRRPSAPLKVPNSISLQPARLARWLHAESAVAHMRVIQILFTWILESFLSLFQ
jgi:hypothetical protein